MATTVLRGCNLCEAGCGLVLEVDGDRIVGVRPDADDPVSHGYVCPKGMAIAELHHDPDRLRRPMRRDANGGFREISWDEAFGLVGERLRAVRAAHGPDAIGVYFGNPMVHDYAGVLMVGPLVQAIGTRNRTSASSQDTAPRFGASYYLYGNTLVVPVPDVDRTDFFLCVGANPVVSQGSAMVTPGVRARLRAIRDRGGKVVTVDPRLSETARLADEHVFIRPGGDAAFLLALASVLVEDGLVRPGVLERDTTGFERVDALLGRCTPERTAAASGIEPGVVRRLAHELAAAPRAVAYTRIGTCNNRHGTLATWAGDVVNVLAGRLGAEGGAMLPEPALDVARSGTLLGINGHGRWHSRVRRLPEIGSDLPASVLAEEMETPGPGQIRAMVTIAGNPVLSTPNGRRLEAALPGLEFMVSVDLYVNETTRHADVILPPCWALAEDHSEPLAPSFAIETHVRYDPPVVPRRTGELADWEILLRLAEEMGGGPTGIRPVDASLRALARMGWRLEPKRMLDLLLRLGPHGDRFLPWSSGINLAKVEASPRGLALGRARTGFRHRIFHRDGRVHLDGAPIVAALRDFERSLDAAPDGADLLLIGRRDLRSNNSWMHNVDALVRGRERCVLFVHPTDAARAGLRDSEPAVLESRVHVGEVPVRVTEEVMPGVVSLPHGWGHAASLPWQRVAGAHAGVSVNDWTDDQLVESVVGQSVLNGVPVRLRAAG
jgi:anaerobic selenocysteine-containing dehydrogenase